MSQPMNKLELLIEKKGFDERNLFDSVLLFIEIRVIEDFDE